MVAEHPDLAAIFNEAIAHESSVERSRFLDEACGSDSQVRERIEALLRAHSNAGGFLGGQSPAPEATDVPVVGEMAGVAIGPYKLLQQIGEGGMGVVYMAEQTEPVRRKVALKVIKPGMDTRQVIARFEAERQALALMDHVNIARVLDAGTAGEVRNAEFGMRNEEEAPAATPRSALCTPHSAIGRPFFVMELVHGVPITQYCNDQRLTPRQRLELFVPVCQAIQHAHQKGIIHRDLKPSNVMITLYDGKPVPKVIDFGVAKATEQKLTERTLFTQYGTIVGTLEYMSPEQAEMSALGVDTRSDVYSLGVLLYELITGTTPLSSKRVRETAYAEILRIIKEEEPPKPSTRLSTSGEMLESISAQRQMDPAKLTKLVRGELDWIVMKCLEKDRNRRYETANSLAADLQRYLRDEPVEACPPLASYRLRKFVSRNWIALWTVALIGVTLVAAAAVCAWQAVRAIRAEGLARVEAERANDEADRASRQTEKARTEAAIATAVNNFLTEDLLAQARPENEPDRDIKLRALVERAAEKVESRFRDQPQVEAAIRHTLGTIYASLGDYRKAEEQHRRATELRQRQLGPEHLDTLWSKTNTAYALSQQNRHEEARKIHAEVLEVKQRFLNPDDPSVLLNLSGIASSYRGLGRLADSERLHREVYEARLRALGPEDRQTLQSQTFLAQTIQMQGRQAEAEEILREVVEIRSRLFRPDHPESLVAMKFLADAIYEQDRLAEAERIYREVYEIRKRVLGPEHPTTVRSLRVLAELKEGQPKGSSKPHWDEGVAQCRRGMELQSAGRLADAALHFRQAITALGNVAEEPKQLRPYRQQLGKCYNALVQTSSDPDEKKGVLSRALPLWEQLAADYPGRPGIWCNLGEVYFRLGQWDKAADAQTKEIELDAESWLAWYRRGSAHAAQRQFESAVADLTKALELKPDYEWSWWQRGASQIHLKQWSKALPDFDRAIELGMNGPAVWLARAAAHARLNQPDSAIADLRQAIAKGYRNANDLKKNEDLAGLRERADFQQLVAEMEATNKKSQ